MPKMAASIKYYVLVVCYIFLMFINMTNAWKANFEPKSTTLRMNEMQMIRLTLTELDDIELIQHNAQLTVVSDTERLTITSDLKFDDIDNRTYTGLFNVSALFLGVARVNANITMNGKSQISNETMNVIIIREEKMIDRAFTISVIVLVAILYINFGAALDLGKVKEILVRPIGPLIAFVCQFLFMPVLSYCLGLILFPNDVEMQLGLFFTGVSPSGGASNTWSVILGGNLDLSISMTTISTFSAFGMMPIWIFTLGTTIFDREDLPVPYKRIATLAIGLIVPLIIGLLIQRYLPRLAKLLVRILKTFSSMLIIFIIVFAIVTNLYLFELFTWQIFVAGMALPWIAYFVGWCIASIFQQKHEDCVAIAIEAGIQNTGISIYILRTALDQPQADLTTIIPVSVALMTPIPLLFYFLYLKGKDRFSKHRRGTSNPNVEYSAAGSGTR